MANFIGTNGNDTIIPGNISPGVGIGGSPPFDLSGNDIISGGGGIDLLNGGGGNDTVLGGSGTDTLGGGTGVDSLDGGTGNDTLSGFDQGSTFSDTLHGGDNNDRVNAYANDRAFGDAGNDTLSVRESGIFQLDGGSGTDTLKISGNRSIIGATLTSVEILRLDDNELTLTTSQLDQFTTIDGVDSNVVNDITLAAGGTAVVGSLLVDIGIQGSAQDDHLTFGSSSPGRLFFEGKGGDDSAVTGTGDDTLIGGDGDDVLTGNGGDDLLDGGGFSDDAGTDELNGGEGDDTLRIGDTDTADGGSGDDVFEARVTTASFVAAGGSGTDTLVIVDGPGDITTATISDVEVLRLETLADVTLTVAQAQAFDTVTLVTSFDPVDFWALRLASSGAVAITLDDTPGPDDLFVLQGAGGSDTLSIDYLQPGTVAGAVRLDGASGRDILTGGSAGEQLIGGAGDDTLDGGAGDDELEGGKGNDTLIGASGDDVASYADFSGDVTVSLALAGAQNTGAGGLDTLSGIEGLIGGGGDDTLTGGTTNDELFGGAGDDTIEAGDGDDLLEGGVGGDKLDGGVGFDIYLYGEGNNGNDKIRLTNGIDVIRFEVFQPIGDEVDQIVDSAIQVGSTVRVQLNPGTTITLLNFTVAQLDENDFQLFEVF